jgi:hypothetical protein
MAPEITIAESDVNYDDDDDPVNRTPPNSTKETDVFAFSMVALEVSYSAFEVRMFCGIFCVRLLLQALLDLTTVSSY